MLHRFILTGSLFGSPKRYEEGGSVSLKNSVAHADKFEDRGDVSNWGEEESAIANSEGWNIYNTEGSEGGDYQLQRNDEDAVFEDDIAAIKYVSKRAKEGSEFHKKAIAFIEKNNPKEFKLISKYSDGGGVAQGWTDEEKADAEAKLAKGGKVKQTGSTTKEQDKLTKAKRVGYRYTDERAKKLGVSPNAKPTKEHIEKYLGNGVYEENRKNRSDVSRTKKLRKGGYAGNKTMMEKIQAEVKRLKAELPDLYKKHTDYVKKAAANLKELGEL